MNDTLLFVGHSLNDSDIRQVLLELGHSEKRPRYYTVTPNLTGPQIRMLESRRITPIHGTFEAFLRSLDADLASPFRGVVVPSDPNNLPIAERFTVRNAGLSPSCIAFLESDVDYVRGNMATDTIEPTQFYRGHNPRWSAIAQNLDVRRHLQDTVLSDIVLETTSSKQLAFHVLKGHAGSGKSVLLQRIAWDAALHFNALCLFLHSNGTATFDVLRELSQVLNERIYLFVDDIGDHVGEIVNLIVAARRYSLPLTIIGAERLNEWNMYCDHLEPYIR